MILLLHLALLKNKPDETPAAQLGVFVCFSQLHVVAVVG